MAVIVHGSGGGAEKVTIDGVKVQRNMNLKSETVSGYINILEEEALSGILSMVVYKEALYILTRANTNWSWGIHVYKEGGLKWLSRPAGFSYDRGGVLFVYNDKLYLSILEDEDEGNFFTFEKQEDDSWVKISEIAEFANTSYNYGHRIIIYNGEPYLFSFGSSEGVYVHKWNEGNWIKDNALSNTSCRLGGVVVINNEIHLLSDRSNEHYKWNGSEWIQLNDLTINPQMIIQGDDGVVHSFGTSHHVSKDCETWTEVSTNYPFVDLDNPSINFPFAIHNSVIYTIGLPEKYGTSILSNRIYALVTVDNIVYKEE